MYREGKTYTTGTIEVYDHDFPSLATAKAIPHGIYDLQYNLGYIQIGTSHETSEFACDSIRYWWEHYGQWLYPNATGILILCDCGGSNNARHYLFKEQLQQLANELNLEIRIAHYPPYTSKYNPIEHRLFPHLSRVCQGVILTSIEMVKDLMATASTRTGLKVFTTILDKGYQTGKQVTEEFKENMKIVFDDYLPQWNYKAVPLPSAKL